jgi:hypothetical protein
MLVNSGKAAKRGAVVADQKDFYRRVIVLTKLSAVRVSGGVAIATPL